MDSEAAFLLVDNWSRDLMHKKACVLLYVGSWQLMPPDIPQPAGLL